MTDIILYSLGRAEHLRAVAAEFAREIPGCRVHLATPKATEKPDWAASVLNASNISKEVKASGISGIHAFVTVISNEPAYVSPGGILKALWLSVALRPVRRQVLLFGWSGRKSLPEGVADASVRAAGLMLRPFYLLALRLARPVLDTAFRLISGKKRTAPYDPARIGKVLVLSLDLLGDFVWNVPAVSAIKKKYPDMQVDLLVHPGMADAARMATGVDRVLTYDAPWLSRVHHPTGGGGRSIYHNLITRIGLLREGYDLVIDLRGEPRHAILGYLTGAPHICGFAGKQAGPVRSADVARYYTHLVSPPAGHVMERGRSIVSAMGFDAPRKDVWLDPGREAVHRVRGMLAGYGVDDSTLLIGIQPGASRPEKRWGKTGFQEVSRRLIEAHGATVVITGTPAEAELAAWIASRLPESCINLAGRTTVREYAAVVAACRLFITNDSSAISISSAVGTDVVCFMLTPPGLLGPVGVRNAVIQKRPPCWEPVGDICFCPYGSRCLLDITPDEVVDAVEGILNH